jgi:hypothetical protein
MRSAAGSETVQIGLRIPAEWLGEADAIAKSLSRPGLVVTRTDAFRAAIAKGLEALTAERKAAAKRSK